MNNVEQFKDAMRAAGLIPPDAIEPGRIVRFSTSDKRGDDAGWCWLFDDGCGGAYGDHRSVVVFTLPVSGAFAFYGAGYCYSASPCIGRRVYGATRYKDQLDETG